MMLRCTWLVPPAMRPPGAASIPAASGPASIASAPERSPRSIETLNMSSVMPSFISEPAVLATGPCRNASAR